MVLPHEEDGDGNEDFEAAFNRTYKSEFGFMLDTKNIIVDDIKVSPHRQRVIHLCRYPLYVT